MLRIRSYLDSVALSLMFILENVNWVKCNFDHTWPGPFQIIYFYYFIFKYGKSGLKICNGKMHIHFILPLRVLYTKPKSFWLTCKSTWNLFWIAREIERISTHLQFQGLAEGTFLKLIFQMQRSHQACRF